MPELVDRGYLYIAQPPLLKVGKGKSEIYLKEERELNDYVLKRICEKKVVKPKGKEKQISEHKLYLFMGDLSEYLVVLSRLEKKGFQSNFIEILIKNGVKDKKFLQNRQKMSDLNSALARENYNPEKPVWDEEKNLYEMVVKYPQDDINPPEEEIKTIKIGRGLVFSSDFQQSLVLGKKIISYDNPPFSIFDKSKENGEVIVKDKKRLYYHMMEEGKKGIMVQRYKGLGEMNPEQLWKTTMDPESRTLLQVKVEDVVETDEIFTILMGDEVEPRREFIQNNALDVSTLDI
jgi:DNA gyrase subunit B